MPSPGLLLSNFLKDPSEWFLCSVLAKAIHLCLGLWSLCDAIHRAELCDLISSLETGIHVLFSALSINETQPPLAAPTVQEQRDLWLQNSSLWGVYEPVHTCVRCVHPM